MHYIRMKYAYRPTTRSSLSVALGRSRRQMSIVKIVELELKIEVREDINAAIITANIIPDSPGKSCTTEDRREHYKKTVGFLLGFGTYQQA